MTRFLLLLLSVAALATITTWPRFGVAPDCWLTATGRYCFMPAPLRSPQATHALQAQSAHERGCIEYHYYEDPATRNNFLLVSEWATTASIEAYYRQQYVVDYVEKLLHWLSAPAAVRIYETVKHQTASIQAKP